MALQRHWVSRANVSGSGCYKQLTKIHKLRKSVTCPAPNLVRKGWGFYNAYVGFGQLRLLELTFSEELYGTGPL